MIKKITVFLFFIAFSGSVLAQQTNNEEKKRFIDDLLSKMTNEEKVGQLRLISVGDNHQLDRKSVV